jgi:hypothetical protein
MFRQSGGRIDSQDGRPKGMEACSGLLSVELRIRIRNVHSVSGTGKGGVKTKAVSK